MKLVNFPKTFGIEELAKGYFPHLFNKKENENYVGPIPPTPYRLWISWMLLARMSAMLRTWYCKFGQRKTMHELHQSTMERTEFLKKEGYNVVEAWECDVKREMHENMKDYSTLINTLLPIR